MCALCETTETTPQKRKENEKMKQMKKWIALLLALAMVCSLAACGETTPETTKPSEAPETTPPDTQPAVSADGHTEVEELGSGTVKWSEKKTADGWILVTNEGGDTLGYSPDSGVTLIQVDGYAFKDMDRDGKLDVYEDWRVDNETRAAHLANQMDKDEMIPLFTHGGWMGVASTIDETNGDWEYIMAGGRGGVTRSSLGEGQTSVAIQWTNALQALCEATGNWGLPAVISVDPSHVSNTIDQNSLAATMSTEEAFKLGVEHGKQYRAVGVTMLLGPQIDIGTQPTWTRATGAYTEDPALSRDLANAYISGLQSTWAEDGTDLGWGVDSVYAIAKHYAGAGASEGGRNDHMDAGKYTVFPGNNFGAHLVAFFDGAWNLDSKTEYCGVMPNYGISVSRDGSLGELVGGAYSEFKMGMLEDSGYKGYIITDWQITNDGQQPFGVEDYTKAERFAMLYATGNDSVGGTAEVDMAAEGFEIFADEVGEEEAMARLVDLTNSFVLVCMQLELFENPYVDYDAAINTVWTAETDAFSKDQQQKSVIMLKNSNGTISAATGEKKTVYIPYVYTPASAGNSSSAGSPASWAPAMDINAVSKLFNVVTDVVGEPTGEADEEGNPTYTENDIIRASAAEIAACDYIIVNMEAPSQDSSQDADGNWLPASLQYGEYTADAARRESLAGDTFTETVNDGYYGTKTQETKENRSYYGNTVGRDSRYSQLEMLQWVNTVKGDAKVIVLMSKGSGPSVMIFSEVEPLADAILFYYGTSSWFYADALLELVNGDVEPYGLLPFQMPASMAAVEAQDEDVPRDCECYVDADGNVYDFAYGLNWSGKIEDERVATYSAEPLTTPETYNYNP